MGNEVKAYRTEGAGYILAWITVIPLIIWIVVMATAGSLTRHLWINTELAQNRAFVIGALFFDILVAGGWNVLVIYAFKQANNAKTILSDSGIMVQNWRQQTVKHIPWDSITGLVYTWFKSLLAGSRLEVEVEDPVGGQRREYVGSCHWMIDLQDTKELKDDIIERLGLTPVGIPQGMRRIIAEQTTWRR